MNQQIFVAAFLGCLFAFVTVAIVTWQLIRWTLRKWVMNKMPEIVGAALHSVAHGDMSRVVPEGAANLSEMLAQMRPPTDAVIATAGDKILRCACGASREITTTTAFAELNAEGWHFDPSRLRERREPWMCPACSRAIPTSAA